MGSETATQGKKVFACDAVLLDAAGTLIKPRKPVGETYAEIAARYGAELEPGRLMQAFVEVFRNMPDLAFKWATKGELGRLERDWWRTLVQRVVARTSCVVDDFDAFFDTLYRHYAAGEAWRVYPDVEPVLDGLRARGCKLAVVSNFDSRLPGILEALGIASRLDAIVYSTRAGSAKPDAAIFMRALGTLGVPPERAVHVGDNLEADYEGAAGAGLSALLIQRDKPAAELGSDRISSLEALLSRVRA